MPKLGDFDDPSFDPFEADERLYGDFEDIYTPLLELRRIGPVHEAKFSEVIGDRFYRSLALPGQREFMILGYEEVLQAALDTETFANGPVYENSLKLTFGNTISAMDPPIHNRYRRIFQAAFLPKTIASWSDNIVKPVIDGLMSRFLARGSADLVQEFARLYPFEVIYRQLNLPQDEARTFHRLAVAQMLLGDADYFARAQEASAKLGHYFSEVIKIRRNQPGTDLISVLVQAEVDGERLPDEVVVSFLRQLVNAGGDTTYKQTCNLLFALLTNPDQLEAVRHDRSLVPQTIEEALRWETPSPTMPRFVTRDVRIAGVEIPAGAYVELFFGVANRDERIFPEAHRFDIFRARTRRHLGFGHGPHLCIGQHLARVEITNALVAILDCLRDLRLDLAKPRPVIRGRSMRYPKHLRVLFG